MTGQAVADVVVALVLAVVLVAGLTVVWVGTAGVVREGLAARHHARLHRDGQDCGACPSGSTRRL